MESINSGNEDVNSSFDHTNAQSVAYRPKIYWYLIVGGILGLILLGLPLTILFAMIFSVAQNCSDPGCGALGLPGLIIAPAIGVFIGWRMFRRKIAKCL